MLPEGYHSLGLELARAFLGLGDSRKDQKALDCEERNGQLNSSHILQATSLGFWESGRKKVMATDLKTS